MGETRRNRWKYQAFKSMQHYESLHVCEASTRTVLSLSQYVKSCPSASMDAIIKYRLTDFYEV
jgi:hypothetical protein